MVWGGDGREAQEGWDICIHTADSLCCAAETNTALKQLYSNKKKEKIMVQRIIYEITLCVV